MNEDIRNYHIEFNGENFPIDFSGLIRLSYAIEAITGEHIAIYRNE